MWAGTPSCSQLHSAPAEHCSYQRHPTQEQAPASHCAPPPPPPPPTFTHIHGREGSEMSNTTELDLESGILAHGAGINYAISSNSQSLGITN